jgi:hypothetical protein
MRSLEARLFVSKTRKPEFVFAQERHRCMFLSKFADDTDVCF